MREQSGLNLYAYCQNDPINKFDPLGLVEMSPAEWLDMCGVKGHGVSPVLAPVDIDDRAFMSVWNERSNCPSFDSDRYSGYRDIAEVAAKALTFAEMESKTEYQQKLAKGEYGTLSSPRSFIANQALLLGSEIKPTSDLGNHIATNNGRMMNQALFLGGGVHFAGKLPSGVLRILGAKPVVGLARYAAYAGVGFESGTAIRSALNGDPDAVERLVFAAYHAGMLSAMTIKPRASSNTGQQFLASDDQVLAVINDGKILAQTPNLGLSHQTFVERTMGAVPKGAYVVTVGKMPDGTLNAISSISLISHLQHPFFDAVFLLAFQFSSAETICENISCMIYLWS